ncbi:MAG: helix-turn-helix transcriptional regulator, partial [bacterium]
VLDALGARMDDFAALVTGATAISRGGRGVINRRIPLIGLAQAGGEGSFDDGGDPVGGTRAAPSVPELGDPTAYAVEISGVPMARLFRVGVGVIVSPAARVRRGDRVVVRTRRGEVMAKELRRHSAKRIDVASLNPAHPSYSFELPEIAWVHRIVWASQ